MSVQPSVPPGSPPVRPTSDGGHAIMLSDEIAAGQAPEAWLGPCVSHAGQEHAMVNTHGQWMCVLGLRGMDDGWPQVEADLARLRGQLAEATATLAEVAPLSIGADRDRWEREAKRLKTENAHLTARDTALTEALRKSVAETPADSRPPGQVAFEVYDRATREALAIVTRGRDQLRADFEDLQAAQDRQWARCPDGCGCRLATEDADAKECGCDGPCTMECRENGYPDAMSYRDLAVKQAERERSEARQERDVYQRVAAIACGERDQARAEVDRLRPLEAEAKAAHGEATAYRAGRDRIAAELTGLDAAYKTLQAQCEVHWLERQSAESRLEKLAEGGRALERVIASHERAMYAAWIDTVRHSPGEVLSILHEQLDGFDGPEWNEAESGTEWLERLREARKSDASGTAAILNDPEAEAATTEGETGGGPTLLPGFAVPESQS